MDVPTVPVVVPVDRPDRMKPVRFPSRSTPGGAHFVRFPAGGGVVCSCPGFFYRGTCRHVIQTLDRLESKL